MLHLHYYPQLEFVNSSCESNKFEPNQKVDKMLFK